MTRYRLALSRAALTVTHPDGSTDHYDQVTVTARGDQASAKLGRVELAAMEVADVTQVARKQYAITGTDGTVWTAKRRACGACP